MAISGDYPHPVTVNGFSCRNCTEVDEAKKHIDPAHPKDGPYGVNAEVKPSGSRSPAVILSGELAGLTADLPATPAGARRGARRLDISA
jgi:hypothetical protein